MSKVRCQTKKHEFTVDYPEAVKFADDQASVFWPHNEVKVHKDKQDILVNMSESERKSLEDSFEDMVSNVSHKTEDLI